MPRQRPDVKRVIFGSPFHLAALRYLKPLPVRTPISSSGDEKPMLYLPAPRPPGTLRAALLKARSTRSPAFRQGTAKARNGRESGSAHNRWACRTRQQAPTGNCESAKGRENAKSEGIAGGLLGDSPFRLPFGSRFRVLSRFRSSLPVVSLL